MLEFYFITILDGIKVKSEIFMIISSIIAVFTFVFHLAVRLDGGDKAAGFALKKVLKISTITFITTMIFSTLIPSKTEMLMILGVGGTVDYLKENDTAKQIPDKCLKLLDKWINEELEESEKQQE